MARVRIAAMKLIITLVSMLLNTLLSEGAIVCSDTFSETVDENHLVGTSCYYGFAQPKNYTDAKTLCESGGAHIVFFESSDETDDISVYFPAGTYAQIWIGARKISGSWKWVDGAVEIPVATTEFYSLPLPTEECARTDDMFVHHLWLGADEQETHKVICEKLGATPTSAPIIRLATSRNYYQRRYVPSNERGQIDVKEVSSVIECARHCVRNISCVSVMFTATHKKCKRFAVVSPMATDDGCSKSDENSCWDDLSR